MSQKYRERKRERVSESVIRRERERQWVRERVIRTLREGEMTLKAVCDLTF